MTQATALDEKDREELWPGKSPGEACPWESSRAAQLGGGGSLRAQGEGRSSSHTAHSALQQATPVHSFPPASLFPEHLMLSLKPEGQLPREEWRHQQTAGRSHPAGPPPSPAPLPAHKLLPPSARSSDPPCRNRRHSCLPRNPATFYLAPAPSGQVAASGQRGDSEGTRRPLLDPAQASLSLTVRLPELDWVTFEEGFLISPHQGFWKCGPGTSSITQELLEMQTLWFHARPTKIKHGMGPSKPSGDSDATDT